MAFQEQTSPGLAGVEASGIGRFHRQGPPAVGTSHVVRYLPNASASENQNAKTVAIQHDVHGGVEEAFEFARHLVTSGQARPDDIQVFENMQVRLDVQIITPPRPSVPGR